MRCVALRAARERQAQFAIALEAANNSAILARTQYRAGPHRLPAACSRPSARCSPRATASPAAAATRRSRWSSSIARSAAAGIRPPRPQIGTQPDERHDQHHDRDQRGGARQGDARGLPRRAGRASPGTSGRSIIAGAGRAGRSLLLLLSRCFAGDGARAAMRPRRCGAAICTVTVSATGNLQPTNEVQVGSEQSGLVTQVFVDNNDRVAAGQPLARLDTARLQDTIVQAQAGLASAQAQVATAQASAAQARANLARQEEVYRVSGGRVPSRDRARRRRAPRTGARVAGVRAAAGAGRAGARPALLGADQPVQGDHLFAGHRRRALAPDRSRPDRRRLVPGAGPVHHRRGSVAR